jgi:integrase/recombinase XerD
MVLQQEVDHIKLNEVEALLRACDMAYERSIKSDNYRWIRDRDKLLITIMWSTGARVTDVVNMKKDGISYRDSSITFLVKKRKIKDKKKGTVKPYYNSIILESRTMGEIADYCNNWEIKNLLFPHVIGSDKTMVRQTVNKSLKTYSMLVGIRDIHPHLFRHGIAIHLLNCGVPIEAIAYHLGHADTKTTLDFYARFSAQTEKSILESHNVNFWR